MKRKTVMEQCSHINPEHFKKQARFCKVHKNCVRMKCYYCGDVHAFKPFEAYLLELQRRLLTKL